MANLITVCKVQDEHQKILVESILNGYNIPFFAKGEHVQVFLNATTDENLRIVYSIGRDLTDDGGSRNPQNGYNRGDVIFEIPAAWQE